MTYLLWAFYLTGWLTVILKRAYDSSKNPLTPWDNVAAYFARWLPGIIMNFGITTALFLGVWRDTSFLTKMLEAVGVHKDVQVPLNPFTAIMFGIASDKIADIIISALTYLISKAKAILPGNTDQGGSNDPNPKP